MAIRKLNGPEYRYSLDEAARFLQYDREAVRYWLRTGHLAGRLDARTGEWVITNRDLIAFLRTASDPMPTGLRGRPSQPLHDALASQPGEARMPVSISPN